MMEIISKSKFYKAQKVKEKEEDESLMAKLDEDFSTLAQTEALRALSHPSKMNALKALLNKDIKRESLKEGLSGLSDNKLIEKGLPDAYDKLVKELGSDRRAHASDRTKTPEEIAQEEKEHLEELEKQRQERMLATDDLTDEGSDDDTVEIQNSASIKIRPTSGDDLGDSFLIADDVAGKKGWIDGIYEQNDADNQDESGSSSQDSEGDEDNEGNGDGNDGSGDEHVNISTMKDWEQSDDDDDGLNMDSEETDNLDEKEVAIGDKLSLDLHEVKTSSSHETNAAGNLAPAKEKELPYVIEAPKNLPELCSLLDSRSDDEVVEIINRIRAYNSIRLAAENRKKMQIFYGVLLQYFAVLATQSPLNFKIINSLVKPLVEMSAETPYFAAICARQRLIHIRTRFLEDIKNPGRSCWPTLKTLLLLRLWSLVFPCSDFRHVVMTPALLLMCEYLMRCPINSGQDAACGSFLCSLVFSVCKQSQKFCPEAIIYLQTLLTSSIELKLGLQQHSQLNHLMEIRVVKPWLHITDQACAIRPLDFFAVMEMQEESPFFASDTFRASVLSSVSETLKGFIIIYEGFSSFAEIFSPISNLLHDVLQNPNLPGLLRDKMQDVLDLIRKTTDEHHMFRKPLQMRKQKPVPIKLLNPKFEENFVKGRDYDPDRERSEMKKLKKLLKSEKKGAIRELRKDSQFVSGLKETTRLMQEEERAEKYGKAMAFLQEQESAFKSGQLGKGRKRKR
ncbi:Nop14-like family [Musa troglodytarum]|nr:Nop14-like family [Musa troglodytarum]